MPFQPGNPGGPGGNHGGNSGRPSKVHPKWRDRFFLALHSKMLPKAERVLLGMLRSKNKEDRKWAAQLVIKKTIPDQFESGTLGNTLASLLESAGEEKKPIDPLTKKTGRKKKNIPRGSDGGRG